MTKENFDKAFKIFTRFLKEHNNYYFIMNYLFPFHRNKYEILKAMDDNYIAFYNILHMIPSLGPSYRKYGHAYWVRHVSQIDKLWVSYWHSRDFNYI